ECMVFLLMGGAYLRSRIKQAGKWDQETIVSFFLCQYCSGEYLPAPELTYLVLNPAVGLTGLSGMDRKKIADAGLFAPTLSHFYLIVLSA
ncbi:hypothetical protein VCX44_15695, partial [Aeromonas caviae]